ncbi:hypothetical protein [Mucilaginibacter gotjawali]|uniref:Sugar lactone lactonase YvrE n=1 Tax=Mucilaginibacter gotjawali TaxID=1550579 RepID=A0A839SG63_9SPHI|nr:hypothetical protein [Mucilaginibacter gotjawali]MBB3056796.1 sugar lactone lactonase YvrE [Mucilaginibacter gotjawali]
MKRPFILFLTSAFFFSACSKKSDTATQPIGPIVNTPTVTTFAGSGKAGAADGTKAQAEFNFPTGIGISSDGFIFVADKQNNLVRVISPQGVVNSLNHTTSPGFSNGKDSLSFNFPAGVCADASGNVFVADQSNGAVREINTSGVATTFATGLSSPVGTAADAGGNIYVASSGLSIIFKITSKGVKSILAGTGVRGANDGAGSVASFNQPQALAVDASGNVYVADKGNNLIRKILPDGTVSTIAGSGTAGAANGTGTSASFDGPAGIAVDASGNLFVGDSDNNLIRKITPAGVVSTYAGSGAKGSENGALTTATFNSPQGVAVDQYGRVFVADTGNSLIRMINP